MRKFKFELIKSDCNGEFYIEFSEYEVDVNDYVIYEMSDGYDSFSNCMIDLNKFINDMFEKYGFNYNSDEIIFESNNVSLI